MPQKLILISQPQLVACSLLLASSCWGSSKKGLNSISDNQRVVTVRGLSEKEVSANKVTWPIVSKEVGNDLPSIYNNIEKTNAAIMQFLKANGIKDNEISINAPQVVDMQADRYNSNPLPYRYNVTNVLVVTSSQVELVRKLIEQQTQLLKQGIAIVAGDYQYQTTYEYTELNSVKPAMIADATKTHARLPTSLQKTPKASSAKSRPHHRANSRLKTATNTLPTSSVSA